MSSQYDHGIDHGLHHLTNEMADSRKAAQACMTCRRQKRRCDKAFPQCSLCRRMNRQCDYSDPAAHPTSDDFNTLKDEVANLRQILQGGSLPGNPIMISSPGALSGPEAIAREAQNYAAAPQQDNSWQGAQNRFPAFAFLDKDAFKTGGITVPKPNIEIPSHVLDIMGDGTSVQEALDVYFATVHVWMPIISRKRLEAYMASPTWNWGPDTAFLFLCIKLICLRPQDGLEVSQNHIYVSAKRVLSLLEATGTVSLLVLQAALLIVWYEYGQAIYPAAYMTAGWCKRYGILLDINNHPSAYEMLGRPETWTEQEERRRTWWGVLISDRVVKIGSQGHILNSQEPKEDAYLPSNDTIWDEGDIAKLVQHTTSPDGIEVLGPFARLCQGYMMLGRVYKHRHGEAYTSEHEANAAAILLYDDSAALATSILDEARSSPDNLTLATPVALIFSTLYALCDSYNNPGVTSDDAAAKVQTRALDGLDFVSLSVVDFAKTVDSAAPEAQDLDRVSPLVMDCLYQTASHHAWRLRESGDQNSQMALDSIRHSLQRLAGRWRNAAEYLRFLEAQELCHYAVQAGV
ncbi:hypothetical protein BJ878DRAFT_520904 [Calycina marina]|uniref:Zn(2)-C6 fungal-type domain-containing protein n=1 Tax=Calycina marina TaxID=1763456 RepID=A0A9P7YXV7_9HELO|nr:hypothetical protein BJ878DRAFT_520904 [Calycina marina]